MSWNGSGVFNRIYSWSADAAAGIDITASRMDADTNSITSNGFGNTLTRDGQGFATSNLPMGGFKHTGVANGSVATEYLAYGQLQSPASLAITVSGLTVTSTVGITGTTTNDAPAAGNVGQTLSSGVVTGTVSSGVPFNLATCVFTAGAWDADAYITFTASGGGQLISCQASITPTPGVPGAPIVYNTSVGAVNNSLTLVLPRIPLSLAGSVSYCIYANASSTSGSIAVSGELSGRRPR